MNQTNASSNGSSFALAIETSSAMGCIAVGRGATVLATTTFTRPRSHAVEFMPSLASLCRSMGIQPRQIEFVYVSAGPGSFTGLRIGITAARALALAVGARIVALGTLEVIAQNAFDLPDPPDQLAVVLDAKRHRVYAATFERRFDQYAPLGGPREADPAEFLATLDRDCAVMGEGVLYHQEVVAASRRFVLPKALYPPRAKTVYRLGVDWAARGRYTASRDLTPVYIRRPEAEEVWEKRHGPRLE